jgi:hypothetical protein
MYFNLLILLCKPVTLPDRGHFSTVASVGVSGHGELVICVARDTMITTLPPTDLQIIVNNYIPRNTFIVACIDLRWL